MSIYQFTDPTAEEMTRLFWSLVPVVAEQAAVTPEDAVTHMRRAWADALKAIRTHQGIDYRDDGRAALWRVRLMLWRSGPQGQQDLFGDSDSGARYDQYDVAPGLTTLRGLSAVADWARELCAQAHPHATIEGLSAEALALKIKSLRVALSNAGGRATWRLRYTATPIADTTAAPPTNALKRPASGAPQHFMAVVYVQREESPHNSR